jgi:thiosulfate reductase cytochrome b subunit
VWFLIMAALTKNDRSYWKLPPHWFRGVFDQARYYLVGVFRGEPHPFHPTRERRFNPLQQTTYLKVMYLLFPLLAVSGVLLLYPEVLPETVAGYPGTWVVATLHYLCSAVLTLFLIGHLYLITLGDRARYGLQSMIDGVHRSHRPDRERPTT